LILLYRAASEGPLKGIMGYVEEDLVSTDFVGDSRYAFALYQLLGANITLLWHTVMLNFDGVL
jgi:glyceraldehyde-3-phosphate dehydrogenase/erythrose-4-phosphate dehydrogenase